MVTDGPSHLSNNYIRIEKHLQVNYPKEWERMSIFRENLAVENDLSVIMERPSTSRLEKKSPKSFAQLPTTPVR